MTTFRLPAVITLLAAVILPAIATAADEVEVEAKWLDRLDKVDRELLEAWVGYAPPEFASSLTWVGDDAQSWSALRGKVVILQTWSARSSAGRGVMSRAEKLAKSHGDDLAIVLLHTPDGTEKAQTLLDRRPPELPVAIDFDGAYCDDVGFYKRPANLVVDRNGTVRFAGLNQRGLDGAVEQLIAEEYTASRRPEPRPDAGEGKSEAPVPFPPASDQIKNARDLRGQRAPAFKVDDWITTAPNAEGKVVVVDFWATWCGPCVASIPHMNGLAKRFRGDVVVVGISSEEERDFDKGMRRIRKTPGSFEYSLALDPGRSMGKQVGNRGIPYCIVIDSNWIVRWQGHPTRLSENLLAQIVGADKANGGAAGGRPRRWSQASGR